jgi:tRNA threonylcarbamoyladenosine modification (KEOPS) complex  Pcc1 subunit
VNALEAEILIDYDDGEIAEAVAKAVSPDNFKTPRGLLVKTKQREGKVLTKIECKTKLSTFIATIDDLLFYTSIAEKTLQTTKKIE